MWVARPLMGGLSTTAVNKRGTGVQTGTKISLAGHGLLAGWVVFGAWFPSEPLPMAVQDVSIISTEEFARLSQQRAAPVIADSAAPLTPPETETPPEVTPRAAPAEPAVTQPDPVTPPAPDPEVADVPEPQPEPTPPVTAPAAPEPPQTPSLVPDVAETPQLRPTDRVAPTPVAPPEPDVRIDDVAQPEIATAPGSETNQDAQEETAEAAANDRIVTEETEADTDQVASAAPERSLRPQARPNRPAPTPEPEPDPAPQTTAAREPEPAAPSEPEPQEDRAAAVEDALAAALAGGGDVVAPEPSGPPLTSGEREALRLAVQNCWNVGSLSSEALRTTVVVALSLTPDGRPEEGSIRLLSSTGGSGAAANQAFGAARRAILRCGARGFQLPSDKYAQWRNIEMTFNPERMRNR